jgi:hypothetical protein
MILSSYDERGIKRGLAKEKNKGVTDEKINTLLAIIQTKFGEIPFELSKKIKRIKDNDKLDEILKNVVKVNHISDIIF